MDLFSAFARPVCEPSCNLLELWGILTAVETILIILFVALLVAEFVYSTWLGSVLNRTINVKSMGRWAVITGATDGIGKALAFELAKRKVNVVLISRTLYKLEDVRDEIKRRFKVQTKIICVDFTKDYDSVFPKIRSELDGMEIGTLINNVGMSSKEINYFANLKDRDRVLMDVTLCNVHSMQFMTSMLLPQMVKRKKGLIVNISSMAALTPCPYIANYGATKAFVDKFSRDLNMEYSDRGIHIQSITAGGVTTKGNFNLDGDGQTSLLVPRQETFALAVIDSLGMADSTSAYYSHKLMSGGYKILDFLMPRIVKKIVGDIWRKRHVETMQHQPLEAQ